MSTPAAPRAYTLARGRVFPHYLGPADVPWLARLVDTCRSLAGCSRRVLRARLDVPDPGAPSEAAWLLARAALERESTGAPPRGLAPRAVRRRLFLARAAAPDAPRETCLAAVAAEFAVEPAALERALFADIDDERTVAPLPAAVTATSLVAAANLALVQGLLRRATSVAVTAETHLHRLVRIARLRGLICTVRSRGGTLAPELELSGPLAVLRRTAIYGRAMATLVPHLPWCGRFTLRAQCTLPEGDGTLQLTAADAVLPAEPPRAFDSALEARFAREVARLAPAWDVLREPRAVPACGTLVFPDFALVDRRDPARVVLVEIVGFWTSRYLEEKLRRLADARIPNLVLCVDRRLACDVDALPDDVRVVPFRERIDVRAVLGAALRQCE